MLKRYTPKPFRFFQTIYPSVYTFPPQKQENDLIKRYLDQPENGKWVTLDYKDLKYSASEEIDFDWIELQMNYASSLSKRDILTASSYTFRGDRLINSYKRNQLNPEEFEENFYEIDDFSWDSNLFPFFPQFVDILNNDDIIIIDKGQYTYRNYRNMIELGRNVPIETWEKIF